MALLIFHRLGFLQLRPTPTFFMSPWAGLLCLHGLGSLSHFGSQHTAIIFFSFVFMPPSFLIWWGGNFHHNFGHIIYLTYLDRIISLIHFAKMRNYVDQN